ncbi:hypothetical protein G3H63_09350 [Microbacterium resistens]|uniref:hypothetical protein n=1 Tax=Microbacterium resistens TaxID=156977 RepID=UPI001C59CF5D|nr:hypothetical protein [Microbacterium resistens]MBW1639275.1 hypothetical protein [Microbacterium resistens]
MTDIVDGRTGELRLSPAEQAVQEMMAVPDGLYGPPMTPGEIEQRIEQVGDLLAHIARVIVLLYEDRHRAEEKYQGAFADYMVMHEKAGAQLARQYATAKTRTELHDLNLAKEKLRYAEEMQGVWQNRSYGLMNINKKFTGGPR